jgi:hypothetical protein
MTTKVWFFADWLMPMEQLWPRPRKRWLSQARKVGRLFRCMCFASLGHAVCFESGTSDACDVNGIAIAHIDFSQTSVVVTFGVLMGRRMASLPNLSCTFNSRNFAQQLSELSRVGFRLLHLFDSQACTTPCCFWLLAPARPGAARMPRMPCEGAARIVACLERMDWVARHKVFAEMERTCGINYGMHLKVI